MWNKIKAISQHNFSLICHFSLTFTSPGQQALMIIILGHILGFKATFLYIFCQKTSTNYPSHMQWSKEIVFVGSLSTHSQPNPPSLPSLILFTLLFFYLLLIEWLSFLWLCVLPVFLWSTYYVYCELWDTYIYLSVYPSIHPSIHPSIYIDAMNVVTIWTVSLVPGLLWWMRRGGWRLASLSWRRSWRRSRATWSCSTTASERQLCRCGVIFD